MEIAATRMPVLGVASTATTAAGGTAAFAAALGEVGAGVPTPVGNTGAVAGGTMSAVAAVPASSPNPATGMNMPLLASAATIQGASSDALPGETALSQAATAANGQPLATLSETAKTPVALPGPDASATGTSAQEDSAESSAATSLAKAGFKDADKPGQNEPAAPTAPLTASASQGGAAAELTAPAPVEVASELADHLPPELLEEAQAPAAEAPAAPKDVPWMQIAASAQPVQEQASKPEVKVTEASLVGGSQTEAGSTEMGASVPQAADDGADSAIEPFARIVSGAAPERAQQQANAPAPLPAGQPVSQPAGQPVQPTSLLPGAVHASAESHPTAAFRPDKVAREMGVEIARRVTLGGDELVIRLDPAELGRINIRMSVNEQGQLRAIVAADTPGVLEAIRNDISELSRALEQAGVRTDGQSFRFDRGGSGDSGNQWQQRYQQQRQAGTHDGDGSGLATPEDQTTYRRMATNGRINMMA